MSSYIDTDYYWQELSNIANDVLTEMHDIIAERDNNEIVLPNGTYIQVGNIKVVKIMLFTDFALGEEIAVETIDGKTLLVREFDTNDIVSLAEVVNEFID